MHRFGAQRRHRQRSARLRCYTATLSHQLLRQWRLLFRVQHRNDSQVYGAPETVPAAACRSASGTVAASLPQRTLDFSWAGSESLPFSVAFDSQWVSYKSLSCPIISAAWPALRSHSYVFNTSAKQAVKCPSQLGSRTLTQGRHGFRQKVHSIDYRTRDPQCWVS